MASNRYCIDIAKRGTAGCKECKTKIEKGICRIGIVVPNPFAEGDMKQWFHMPCVFQKLSRSKAATKKIEDEDDLEGWDDIDEDLKEEVRKNIKDFWDVNKAAAPKSAKKLKTSPGQKSSKKKDSPGSHEPSTSGSKKEPTVDDAFRTFRKVCASISAVPEYTEKTAILSNFLKNGSNEKGFDGDLYLWMKMLLPGVDKRIYNLQSKQLVKLFSQIFDTDQEEMMDDLNEGDVAETIGSFFEKSTKCKAVKKSILTMQEVELFLEDLSHLSKEEEQKRLLEIVAKKCTSNDLRMFIRLIMHDLRMHAGPKHVLKAIHPTAYEVFQASHNLKDVVSKVTKEKSGKSGGGTSGLSVEASVLTPIKPMLAEACGSIEKVFEKCRNRPLAEIKYDGERVQVHKSGNEFSYFSRSLKPVMPGKVIHLKDYIPKAFPHGNDLILDSEILLVDSKGTPLPFGTLGEHKKKAFKDANVCLFVFDCIQFNDESLIKKPLKYRRKVLNENIKEIKNHVVLSEMKPVNSPDDLKEMIESVISQGLEGLVIKDEESIYEPGKRHWLKMKKDYLKKGDVKNAMPDTADLLVVGAYYGTGRKGGIMSVFLMACYNERTRKWCTVTKVGGRTDADLEELGETLEVEEINKDPSRVPKWLDVTKSLTPDFVVRDPQKSEVWEIKGAEFTKAEAHTADGISIRFPRFVKKRTDKTAKEATTLEELKGMYEVSKQTSEIVGLSGSSKKRKSSEKATSPSPSKKKKDESSSSSRSSSPNSPKSKGRSKSPASKKTPSKMTPTKKTSKGRSASKSPVRKESPSKGKMKERIKSRSPIRKSDKQPDENMNTEDLDITIKRRISKEFDHDLPNVFSGVKLYLSKSLQDYDTLRKYFIAFDGKCVKEHEKMNASHYVSTSQDDDFPLTATRISPEWLWDCIKMKQLLPAYLYDVKKET